MRKKGIIKITFAILFILLGIWSKSLLPYIVALFFFDSLREVPFYQKVWSWLKERLAKKISIIEWIVAVSMAIWLLTFVQNNFIGIYTFHTSSMHQTLQVADVLWVNKLIPGPRHNCNDISEYKRSTGIAKLNYCDVIMFNFPEADTLLQSRPTESFHYLRRLYGQEGMGIKDKSALKYLEVDERPRFVKRVFGLPGDSIKIDYGKLYANGRVIDFPKEGIDRYVLDSETAKLLKEQGIIPYNEYLTDEGIIWELLLKDYEHLREDTKGIKPNLMLKNFPDPLVFPFNSHLLWNVHYMGPIYVPKKGDTVKLTKMNLDLYARAIHVFEQNQLKVVGDKVWINEKQVSEYTFKMNYYWVMGDNLPHSFDSRFWGFLPENHIIGKVERVILSKDISKKGWFSFRKSRYLKKIN